MARSENGYKVASYDRDLNGCLVDMKSYPLDILGPMHSPTTKPGLAGSQACHMDRYELDHQRLGNVWTRLRQLGVASERIKSSE